MNTHTHHMYEMAVEAWRVMTHLDCDVLLYMLSLHGFESRYARQKVQAPESVCQQKNVTCDLAVNMFMY